MLNHADYGRTSEFVGQGGVGRELAPQTEMDADDKLENLTAEEEPGYGLGLPGLASLTLPSDGMVVPPLNFSMVSLAVIAVV